MGIFDEDLDTTGPGRQEAKVIQIIAGYIAGLTNSTPTQTKTPVNAVASAGTVTFTGTPVEDETLTIGTDVYTFKTSRSVAFEITINANNTTQGDNLDTAIAADATGYTSNNVTGTVTITAAVAGVIGDSIGLATDATGTGVSGTNLENGVDGTVGVAYELAMDASYLYCAVAANTTADSNWRRIDLGSAY